MSNLRRWHAIVVIVCCCVGLLTVTSSDVDAATTPQLHVGDTAVTEGDTGSVSIRVPVTFSAPAASDVVVQYTVEGADGAGSTDYKVSSARSFLMRAGNTAKDLTVIVYGDTTTETAEHVKITVTSAPGTALVDAFGVVTIRDDDANGASTTSELSLGDVAITEADSKYSTVAIPVTLSRPSSVDVTAHISTFCSSSPTGTKASTSTVRIPAKTRGRLLRLKVYGDALVEAREVIAVSAQLAGGNATLLRSTAYIVVDDNETGLPAASPSRLDNLAIPTVSTTRPYDATAAWNTPIPTNPTMHSRSSAYVGAISDNGMALTSDPDQFTIPVFCYNATTPFKTVRLSGYFSTYDAGDNSRVGYGSSPAMTNIPVPANAVAGSGGDGQVIIMNATTGVEYGFYRFAKVTGGYKAENGYRYHTTAGYGGRFADGNAGRGAGTTYLAGLVRPWELAQGRIDHALAFAYDSPSAEFVFPASKSDGGGFGGITGTDLPEGTRLQLNPSLTDTDFNRWGLSADAKVIARALQQYGMYTIDHSGSSKVYLEDRRTAGWSSSINRTLLSSIPWSEFRVVQT